MPNHDIIVVGASAGGIETVSKLIRYLPTDLPAAVFVVIHIPSTTTSILPRIFNRAGTLTAIHPKSEQPIENGYIYVAPSNYHLLIYDGLIILSQGAKENNHRPAIDPLFRSAARFYGPRTVGVILSGNLDDGTAGLLMIKERGGIAIAQDPEEAMFPGMPRNAIETMEIDYILPIQEIATQLVKLAYESIADPDNDPIPKGLVWESEMSELNLSEIESDRRPGKPANFVCPSCGGPLWEVDHGNLLHFRCLVGHAWSEESFQAQQSDGIEQALWTALRVLEQKKGFTQRLADRARSREQFWSAERYEEQIQECKQQILLLKQVLLPQQNQESSQN